jgi:hypothetical protein
MSHPGWGRIVLAVVLLGTSGCSTSRMTVNMMTPVLQNTVDVALRSEDTQLVRDALPTSLLLLEGMIETNPKNRDIAVLASMLYFAYGFAFVEEEDPARASELYDRGRELGWQALDRPETAAAIREGSFAEVEAALEELRERDAEALLWVCGNWGMWIELNLGRPAAVADFARLMPLVERVAELDDTLFWGMPRILLGAMHASRPVMLGGDPERARKEFDRAFEVSSRNLLLAQVFFAKTYCVQTFDQDAFESSLREVLEAPAGQLPDGELLNQIARLQADVLLERSEEIFE